MIVNDVIGDCGGFDQNNIFPFFELYSMKTIAITENKPSTCFLSKCMKNSTNVIITGAKHILRIYFINSMFWSYTVGGIWEGGYFMENEWVLHADGGGGTGGGEGGCALTLVFFFFSGLFAKCVS